MLIDTHTHLYVSEFDNDRDAVIARAKELGVGQFVLPAIDSETTVAMHALKSQYPNEMHLMMGLHPTHVGANVEQELAHVQQQLHAHNFVAVGEIGMDLYWDKSYQKEQQEAFARQIGWALEFDLPIVIHCRDAFDEIFEVLEGVNDKRLRGIFHCFTGTLVQARRAIDLNMLLGIGGVVTFRNSGLAETVAQIPLEHLVLETDAPYLAPMPHRGKRNESSYLPLIATTLAETHNVSVSEIIKSTTENAKKLFEI
jgi:TatD DNase family protein